MVTKLANDYATIKPAMIVQNMVGSQRTQYVGMAVMAQFYLAAFTVNYGTSGSGILHAGGLTHTPV